MALRQGEIYWVYDCPPLHGKVAAPHAVIVLNPASQLADQDHPVHAMVVSSSVPSPGPGHIAMPNKRTHRPCSTCFDRPCWAVSTWVLRVTDRSKLGRRCGHIGGATLAKVVVAFVRNVAAGQIPIDHPPKGESAPRP